MEHHRGAADQGRDLLVAADIGALKIHRCADFFEIPLVARQQIVDHHNLARAFSQQTAHDRGADEARASGDNVVAHKDNDSKCRSDSAASRSAP